MPDGNARITAAVDDRPTDPALTLRQALEERNWTQADFAEVLDRPIQFVNEVVGGKKEITRHSAAQIAAALGTTSEFWLNAQHAYRLWQLSQSAAHQRKLAAIRDRTARRDAAGTPPRTRPVAVHTGNTILVDLRSLAILTGRSVHTIRAHCTPVEHRNGRTLYDTITCEQVLTTVPRRRRKTVVAEMA